jgi:hypothetical protein
MVGVAKVENRCSGGQVEETLLNPFILAKDGLRSNGAWLGWPRLKSFL